LVLEFRGIGAGSHQNLGALRSGGERIELVGGANAAYPYYKDYDTELWMVIYWDGTGWGDEAEIEFIWDSSSTGPSPECIENISAVVYRENSTTYHEGMFFMLKDTDACDDGSGRIGFDLDDKPGESPDNNDDSAIVAAELAN
jgi:hypothetical protein